MSPDTDAFWRKTPREIGLIFAGTEARLTREHNDRMALAWWTALLSRARKKLPGLEKLQIRPRERQSPERMLDIAKQWTAYMGGKITTKPN